MRVLIADDSKTDQLILSTCLEEWGYQPQIASNGDEALQYMLSPDPPRLAILDWVMPGITGPEVVQLVRQNPQGPYIYMILVTALGTRQDIISGLQAGADDYITKPVHIEELKVRLRSGTRLIQAWTQLEHSEKRTLSVIEGANDAILIVTTNGKIQYANPQALILSGANDRQLIGRSLFDFIFDEQESAELLELFSEIESPKTKAIPPQEIEWVQETKEIATVLLRIAPLEFENKKTFGIFLTDLTEQKRLEVELRNAQKMEAVGQLASGISHEINTPMQFIGDSVTYVQESCHDLYKLIGVYENLIQELAPQGLEPHLKQSLSQAKQQADWDFQKKHVPQALERASSGLERVANIVNAMKNFARKDTHEMVFANLNEAIRSTLMVATNAYRYCADIKLKLNDIPRVNCHIGAINQALLNLIINAAHSIEEATQSTSERGLITVSSTLTKANQVEIRVSDTGVGIPADIQHRIFEPFFTTKDVGKGSGQGLAITYTIVVEKHNGQIFFETQESSGTTFTILLPVNGPNST